MISSLQDGIVKVKGLWKEDEEEEPSFFEEGSQVSSKRSESRKRLISFRAFQRLKEKVVNDYERAENGGNSADMKAYRLGVVKQIQCIFERSFHEESSSVLHATELLEIVQVRKFVHRALCNVLLKFNCFL